MGTLRQGGNGVKLGRLLADIASIFTTANERLIKHMVKDSEWLQH